MVAALVVDVAVMLLPVVVSVDVELARLLSSHTAAGVRLPGVHGLKRAHRVRASEHSSSEVISFSKLI